MDDQSDMFPGHQSSRKAAAAGMETAVRTANLQSSKWSDRARSYLTDYARENLHFRAEDVRAWAHEHAIPPLELPPNACAWGAVMGAAAKAGTIVADGASRVRRRPQHAKLCTLWRSNVTSAEEEVVTAPAPDRVTHHLSTGEGRVACGAHRRMRSAAARAALVPADTKAGVTCLRCRGTIAYAKAK